MIVTGYAVAEADMQVNSDSQVPAQVKLGKSGAS
jgi:hypothetical protein